MRQGETLSAAAIRPERLSAPAAEHRFFAVMAAVAALVVTVGFGSSYGPRLAGAAPAATGLIHLHAAVFTVWLILFVAQVALAVRGKIALHRKLGLTGMVLAPLMLISGASVAVQSARLGHRGIPGVEFHDPETFLFLNFSSVFVFCTLAGLALVLRRRPQAHKRLMLMATVGGLLPPAIARLPLVAGHVPAIAALAMGLLLAGPVFDLVQRRRVHLAYLFGFIVTFCSMPPVVEGVAATALWHQIAARIV